MDQFIQMRIEIKKPLTEYGQFLLYKELYKLVGDKTKMAIKCLEQSIFNSWQGIFYPKDALPQNNTLKRDWIR